MENWICVLGMHRSGTSCLAGMLRHSGVHLGEVQDHSPDNPLGNQELRQIWNLGDALLAENGGAWNKPVMVSRWQERHRRERDAILQNLRNAAARRQSPLWGFKDPRTLFTLPFWLEVLPQPRFIGIFRNPQRVALSLNARNAIPVEEGLQLWAAYNGKLPDLSRNHRFPLLNFDLPPGAYLKVPGWIEAARVMIFEQPNLTRTHIQWTPELLAEVKAVIEEFPHLHRYRQTASG